MKKILSAFVLLFLAWSVTAHPWKPQHYVIVDTDCGMDDFRALCLLMASPNVRVLAITVSDGVLDARSGFSKVKALLNDLNHEGVLVGLNSSPDIKPQICFPAEQMQWGTMQPSGGDKPLAVDIVNYVLNNTQENISFISLGTLSTASRCALECPKFASRINQILWSSNPDYKTDNLNYELDTNSADIVISGNLPVNLIFHGYLNQYDDSLISTISNISTTCAEKIVNSLANTGNHYARVFFDESIIFYLHNKALFQADTLDNLIYNHLKASTPRSVIQETIKNILSGEKLNQNQVFSVFPMDSSDYYADVQKIMPEALRLYGREEWVANVLSNELHRHLGVYSVIGVKMGVRAKEYFGAGIDEMSIVSYAGLNPPLSCMNDGLQVSTGATLGHGLIIIARDSLALPQADFIYMNEHIRLFLKPEYRTRIEPEIMELSKVYGLDSNIYWELVRKAAIKYWINFNRKDMFTIQVL